MKKSSKILIVILAAMLLVGVLALAISASEQQNAQNESAIEGKFVVAGVGYETWKDAIAAANNSDTIYLNEDITLTESLLIEDATAKIRIDLNGKTVTISDPSAIATAFNVRNGAYLAITGSGVIENVRNCFGASGGSVISVEGTGANGIAVNHARVEKVADSISAFRVHDRAILNISGFITVNAKNGTRNVIHVGSGSGTDGAAALNISNAKVVVPLATDPSDGTNLPAGYSKLIVLSDNIDVDIDDSEFEMHYGMLINATGKAPMADVTAYKDGNDWKEGAGTSLKIADPTIRLTATNSKFFSDYSSYSKAFAANGHNPGASFIGVDAKMNAHFDDCVIYSDFRAVTSSSNATITTKKLNQHQLLFTDCHFLDAPGNNSGAPFFCYGVNYKIIGGSFGSAGNGIGNGSHYYLPLEDGEGNSTGWVGGYIDNVLLDKTRTFITSGVTGNWNDSSYTPGTAKTHNINILIDGVQRTFTYGYFSDVDKYNSYFSTENKRVWEDYIVQMSSANVEDGSFIKVGSGSATGSNPLGTSYTINTDNGTSLYVYDDVTGNGYIKHFMEKNSGSQSSTSRYQQIVTGSASFATTDAYVWEWDVSTDDAQFINVSFAAQGREKTPRFNASGTYIGVSGTKYLSTPRVDVNATNKFTFNGGSVALSTKKGEWSRITVVVDIVRSELTSIEIPAYTNVNTPAANGAKIRKDAYCILGSKVHVYVNGLLVDSMDFGKADWGYNGYIIKGYENNYYFDQVRIFPSSTSIDASYCVDNVRTSSYPISANVDLGLYNEDGSVKTDINGLEHFLIMPDNNTTVFKETYVAKVDGVNYKTEAEAIAAIKNGSVLELGCDMKTPINVDEIIAKLGVEEISFKIISGGFKVPYIISSKHKIADYTGVFGGYIIKPAGFGELFTVHFYDELLGVSDKKSTVAEGTLFPGFALTAPGEEAAKDGKLWSIIGWGAKNGGVVANGFYAESNCVFTMVAEHSSVTYYYDLTVNGVTEYVTVSAFGDKLAEALAKGDVKVVLWNDVELDSASSVSGNLELDVNGFNLTVNGDGYNVFEVLSGAKFNLYSSREGARIDALGDITLLAAVYDRYIARGFEINVGNGKSENLSVNVANLIDCYDSYVHDPEIGDDSYNYYGNATVNINGITLTDNGASSDGAMIATSIPTVMNASGVNYEGAKTFLAVSSDIRATITANISDSSFASSATLVSASGTGKYVSFDTSRIAAPLEVFGKEIIEIGAGCGLTVESADFAETGLTLKEGCTVALADDNGINSYVDLSENLAYITWYDVNGKVIGSSINAPFGSVVEIFTEEETVDKVGTPADNEWYSVRFTGWDIPDGFELYAGSFNLYPTFSEPIVSVECLKIDLVAYTYFKLNFYLPTENLPEGVELYGIYRKCECALMHNHEGDANYKLINNEWYVLLENSAVKIDGATYNSYTVYPGASDASENEYKIAFAVDGELFVDTFTYGVPTYAEDTMNGIMSDGEITEDEKLLASLIMNMVRYANESYKLASDSVRGAAKYEALLANYPEFLVNYGSISFSEAEKNVNVSSLGEYMEGVSFIFGSYQPMFVFKYRDTALDLLVKPETEDGKIYTWPEGNRGVFTLVYHERYDGTKSVSYIAPHAAYNNGSYVVPDIANGVWGAMTEAYATTVDLSVRDATGIMNVAVYAPDGTVVNGSYSLAAYVEYLKSVTSEARANADAALSVALDAQKKAQIAAEEAQKPENAALKDQYEELQAKYEKDFAEYNAIYLENEASFNENSAFMNASLSLYAFSLASQDYARAIAK